MRILIAFGTCEGQTRKIANFVKRELESSGTQAQLKEVGVDPYPDTREFDGFIVGAPVHGGTFPKELRNWVKANRDMLNSKPSAFFSVCLGILQKDNPEVQAEERKIVIDLFAEACWHPRHWTIFAGALMYSKYGWLKKRVMRSIARKAGSETEMTRDYEYTDWSEVKHFTRIFNTNCNLWEKDNAGKTEFVLFQPNQ